MMGCLIYMTVCPIMLEFIALIFVSIDKMTFKNNREKYFLEKKKVSSTEHLASCLDVRDVR